MALKGLDIFKLTPRTNCKECGHPTCMAFAMKVAQGTVAIEACPHMSADALASLSDASAPPMKTVAFGAGDFEFKLGGETVLFRHDKTFVAKNPFGISIDADTADAKLAEAAAIDYERIGERMAVEVVNVEYRGGAGDKGGSGADGAVGTGGASGAGDAGGAGGAGGAGCVGDKAAFLGAVEKAARFGRAIILEVSDADVAKAALELVKDKKPILNGANATNYEEFSGIATGAGVPLGVSGNSLDEIYDTVKKLEEGGNKNLVIDVGAGSAGGAADGAGIASGADGTDATPAADAFANAVQIRRAAIKDGDRSFGYPTIVNVSKLAGGCPYKETALAALFTLKYGSVVIMGSMSYAQALPLFGLRQNIFTDPQKPMTVEAGLYQINGAAADSPCALTVDFALTYFIVSGEIERSGVPVNLLIPDAGGYSVLTAWAAGKLSAGSIARFVKEHDIESKVSSRDLMIPGKVAVLKGELEESLPGWNIIVAPNEAVSLVKFLKERYS